MTGPSCSVLLIWRWTYNKPKKKDFLFIYCTVAASIFSHINIYKPYILINIFSNTFLLQRKSSQINKISFSDNKKPDYGYNQISFISVAILTGAENSCFSGTFDWARLQGKEMVNIMTKTRWPKNCHKI